MGGLSWWHWMIVLAAFVLLFGAKKLPDAARGVGRSLRILKSEVSAMNADETGAEVRREDGEPLPPAAVLAAPEPATALSEPVLQPSTTGSASQAAGATPHLG